MTLYEISAEIENAIAAIFQDVDEETGEVKEEAVKRLEDLQLEKAEKLDNIGAYIKNLKAEAEALKKEEDALKARRKVKENKAERLTNYVASILDGQKFETPRVSYTFRTSYPVIIDDENLIPKEYIRITKTAPDKTAIKKAIEEGAEITGAHIEETKNMSIK